MILTDYLSVKKGVKKGVEMDHVSGFFKRHKLVLIGVVSSISGYITYAYGCDYRYPLLHSLSQIQQSLNYYNNGMTRLGNMAWKEMIGELNFGLNGALVGGLITYLSISQMIDFLDKKKDKKEDKEECWLYQYSWMIYPGVSLFLSPFMSDGFRGEKYVITMGIVILTRLTVNRIRKDFFH